MSHMKKLIAIMFAVSALPAFANDGAALTPYRPSISSPAQLPSPGQLELEMGGLSAKTNEQRRGSLPYQLKLAWTDEWGVLLGGEAHVSVREAASRNSGVGDTNITLKRAFIVNDTTAYGVELTGKLPTAKDSIGSGKTDYTLNGIFSKDIGEIHMDVNLNATRIAALDKGAGRMQAGLSSSFSMSIAEKWGGNCRDFRHTSKRRIQYSSITDGTDLQSEQAAGD